MSWPWKCRSRSWWTWWIRLQISDILSGGNSNVCIFERLLVKIANWNVWPWKFRARSRRKTFETVQFDGKYQPVKTSYFRIFVSSHRFRDIDIWNIWPWKSRSSHGVQHWQCRSQIANVKIYKRNILQFWISPRFDLCKQFLHTYTHTCARRATWRVYGYRQIYRFA